MKKSIKEKLADSWGLSKEIVMNIPHLTFAGNYEVYIENHLGVSVYTKNLIMIKTPNGDITILGKNLNIDSIHVTDMFISGCFESVKFDFIGEMKNVK